MKGLYSELKDLAVPVGGGDNHIAVSNLLDILQKRAILYGMELERLSLDPKVNSSALAVVGGKLCELRLFQEALKELAPRTAPAGLNF